MTQNTEPILEMTTELPDNDAIRTINSWVEDGLNPDKLGPTRSYASFSNAMAAVSRAFEKHGQTSGGTWFIVPRSDGRWVPVYVGTKTDDLMLVLHAYRLPCWGV